MFPKNKFTFFLVMLYSFCIQLTNAQQIKIIDNKGTIKTANNNNVTSSATAPTFPLENDIWFDTSTTPTLIKIYNDGNWVNMSLTGTEGSIFFASTNGVATENNSQLFWDNLNNRLGIGTDSPSNKFHVTGAIRSEGILNSSGTFGEPSYRFNSDTNTGMFNPAADILGFSVGGLEAINIFSATGNTTATIKGNIELDGNLIDEDNLTGTVDQVLTATATGTKWKSAFNIVINELIFDGDDDADPANDDYRYVSLVVNGDWKVIRYDKTDVNVENIATIANNPGQVAQPTTLAECTALIF